MSSSYRSAIEHAQEALRSGRLVAQRWSDGQLVFYPRGTRLAEPGVEPQWLEIGSGTVMAATTVHEHSHPDFNSETPFTLVLVDAHGARVMCRLDPSASVPAVGTSVALRVEPHSRGPRIVVS